MIPVIYVMYRSYRLYLGKLEDEKNHVEQMAALHLRTIEALALAIDAKDHTTHEHLQRVRVFALAIGKEMGLSNSELEALRAAALLHDIGKLAVPEHIINKPGRLSPEEFEKMKIHPIVGGEILERVNFPYPVVPIVRAHHEKWDGSGYPDGLKGEQIPIGARILAAVDCLDALSSDRQYRRAMPLDAAMAQIASETGKQFDPRVVEILQRSYADLERMAKSGPTGADAAKLSKEIKVANGCAPAAGFEKARRRNSSKGGFLASIVAARYEAQALLEFSIDLGRSLSLDETLSVVAARLRKLVPYDAIAIYLLREGKLIPEFVTGDDYRIFSSLQIPMGEGLSGWVAQNRKPIVNGNPSVEPGYLNDPQRASAMSSALAVPLVGGDDQVLGVLALYKLEADAFSNDHLRILLAIIEKIGASIENAVKYQTAADSATTDYLTGLPNARSLFLQLDAEIARCKRERGRLAVIVCDLDGFKRINDEFGHLAGNQLLEAFASSLKLACREYDYVSRMGGDEFVVIAPGLKREGVQEICARIHTVAANGCKEFCGGAISASVGIAFYPDDTDDAAQLLVEADKRMYAMKKDHQRAGSFLTMPVQTLMTQWRRRSHVGSSILRRLLLVAITIVEGGLVSATLVRYAPGFGADERQLDARLSSDSIQAIQNTNADERSIVRFYFSSLCKTFRGDLGISRSLNRPVRQLLQERAAVTTAVAGKGLALAWSAAILAVFATWFFRAPPLRIFITLCSGTLLCLPASVLALLAIILNQPGYLVIALIVYPKVHRYLSNLVEAARGMPHLITARAKGTSESQIFFWHVVPVIKREVLALAGVSIGLAISAAIPVEALCGIPGIGQLAWQSALGRDLPLLNNVAMLVIACLVLANSGADLLAEERRQPA